MTQAVQSARAGIDLDEVERVAVSAARASGALLRERLSTIREIRHKGVIDLVTDVDVRSEEMLREAIRSAFPTHTIVGEEGGTAAGTDPGYRWIVDPLDGTTNYTHGFPFFCVSVGFEADGRVEVGAVYDPTMDELFLARRGMGATLNGQPMRVSAESNLDNSLLATGFPYDRALFPRALRGFEMMSTRVQAVRRAGSAALDLCYVAAGRLEGYWEFVVLPWDVAAGSLIVEEAGGTITTVSGVPFTVDCGEVLATNGLVHEPMAKLLAPI